MAGVLGLPLEGAMNLKNGFSLLYGLYGFSYMLIEVDYTLNSSTVTEVLLSPFYSGILNSAATPTKTTLSMAAFDQDSSLVSLPLQYITPFYQSNTLPLIAVRLAVLKFDGTKLKGSGDRYLNTTQTGNKYYTTLGTTGTDYTVGPSNFWFNSNAGYAGSYIDIANGTNLPFAQFAPDTRGIKPSLCSSGYWCNPVPSSNQFQFAYIAGDWKDGNKQNADTNYDTRFSPSGTSMFVPLTAYYSSVLIANGVASPGNPCGTFSGVDVFIPLYWYFNNFNNTYIRNTDNTTYKIEVNTPTSIRGEYVPTDGTTIVGQGWTEEKQCKNNYFYNYCIEIEGQSCGKCFGQCTNTKLYCDNNIRHNSSNQSTVDGFRCGRLPGKENIDTFWNAYKWWIIGIIVAIVVLIIIIVVVKKSKKPPQIVHHHKHKHHSRPPQNYNQGPQNYNQGPPPQQVNLK